MVGLRSICFLFFFSLSFLCHVPLNGCFIFRFNYSFGPVFCPKMSNWSSNFFKFQFGPDF